MCASTLGAHFVRCHLVQCGPLLPPRPNAALLRPMCAAQSHGVCNLQHTSCNTLLSNTQCESFATPNTRHNSQHRAYVRVPCNTQIPRRIRPNATRNRQRTPCNIERQLVFVPRVRQDHSANAHHAAYRPHARIQGIRTRVHSRTCRLMTGTSATARKCTCGTQRQNPQHGLLEYSHSSRE